MSPTSRYIFVALIVAGCIPSTRAVINIGSGYDTAAMGEPKEY